MKTLPVLFVLIFTLGSNLVGVAQNYNLSLRSKVAFPNEPIAGVWGYEQDGREYALVGGEDSLHIIEVTNPDVPKRIVSLPMARHWGKEIRTFRHYAYVSTQNGAGLVIYDLQNLPNSLISAYPKKEISQAGGYATYGHTLHIDTTASTLYLNDGGGSRSWIFNLLPDPFAPTFAGFYQQLGGIHDGYADHDTLYAAHINDGFVAVVDMHDKANPKVLQTFETPGKFPHNTWLTKDRQHLIVADEIPNGFLSFWDIHDLENVREVARFQSSPGLSAIPHNAFVLRDHVVASWYSDGVILLDITYPETPVQVGRFDPDTYTGDGYIGCWGNYPYLSSGILLASDIHNGLMVLQPTYARACYLEGTIRDSLTNEPISGVKVYLLEDQFIQSKMSSPQGRFQIGQAEPGIYTALFICDGYRPIRRKFTLKTAEVTEVEVNMLPMTARAKTPSVLVLAAESDQPLANMEVVFKNKYLQVTAHTDAKGWATVPSLYADSFDVYLANWGRLPLHSVRIKADQPTVMRFKRGYYDDFYFDYKWLSEGTTQNGTWVRAGMNVGVASYFSYIPSKDMPDDLGDKCYLTDSIFLSTNLDVGHYVIGGTVRLVSPDIELDDFRQPLLNFNYWTFKAVDSTQQPVVFLENENKRIKLDFPKVLFTRGWQNSGDIILPEEARTGTWHLVVEATNQASGIEAPRLEVGIDVVEIRDGQATLPVTTEDLDVRIWPNPFTDHLRVRGLLPTNWHAVSWSLTNVLGQKIASGNIYGEAMDLTLERKLSAGNYFFTIYENGRPMKSVTVVKI